MGRQIASALLNCGGGPVETAALVYWLHPCFWRTRSVIEGSARWYRTVCSQLKSSSIKAKATRLSSTSSPHESGSRMSPLFWLASLPRCRSRLITNVAFSGESVNGCLNPDRCFSQMLQKGNTGDLFVEKKVDNFIFMCSVFLWSNCLWAFSQLLVTKSTRCSFRCTSVHYQTGF